MFVTILIFIVILAVLIVSHELGHLWAAKRSGVAAEEFGIGFPPRLFSFRTGGTRYCFNLIPLGGYVRIRGEDGSLVDDPASFAGKNLRTRGFILLAGVLMNFLTAGLLMIVIAFLTGPWQRAIGAGLVQTFEYLGLILVAMFDLLKSVITTGQLTTDVLGPVGIASITDQIVYQGLVPTLRFVAILSLNLGIINLLPFPALDGGRLLFLLIEKLKGSPVSQRVEQGVHATGFALLILLMIVVTWQDIGRIL